MEVAQLCPTLFSDPMNYKVHGILQARILEWVAFPFSRESSQPRSSNFRTKSYKRVLTVICKFIHDLPLATFLPYLLKLSHSLSLHSSHTGGFTVFWTYQAHLPQSLCIYCLCLDSSSPKYFHGFLTSLQSVLIWYHFEKFFVTILCKIAPPASLYPFHCITST